MATIAFPVAEVRWTMEELKELLRVKLDDHDLLIEMRTLQREQASNVKTIVDDHESRLRLVERVLYYGLGALALAVMLFKVFGGKFGI